MAREVKKNQDTVSQNSWKDNSESKCTVNIYAVLFPLSLPSPIPSTFSHFLLYWVNDITTLEEKDMNNKKRCIKHTVLILLVKLGYVVLTYG